MHTLLDIYNLHAKKELSDEEAAKAFGLTQRDFNFRLTRWGHKLPMLLATLDKIAADQISRVDAAQALQLSIRQVNHLMNTWKVQRPVKAYLVEQTAASVKWDIRKKHAIDYIADASSIEEAAERSQVSVRQMRRWVSELLAKHFEMVFKDLKHLTPARRRRLADEIQKAEHIDFQKERVINEIVDGKKAITDEVIERLQARNARGMRSV